VCVLGRGNGGFGVYGKAGVSALWKDEVCLMESTCVAHAERVLSRRAWKRLIIQVEKRTKKKRSKKMPKIHYTEAHIR
jgi:hypothetical protein